jgi:hypothetical protein
VASSGLQVSQLARSHYATALQIFLVVSRVKFNAHLSQIVASTELHTEQFWISQTGASTQVFPSRTKFSLHLVQVVASPVAHVWQLLTSHVYTYAH